MMGAIPSAGLTYTQRGWGLLIPAANTYTTFGTKAMSKQELSPFNLFRQMLHVGLTWQTPGSATSTGDELIQRPCEGSRIWIGSRARDRSTPSRSVPAGRRAFVISSREDVHLTLSAQRTHPACPPTRFSSSGHSLRKPASAFQ